MRRSSVDVAIGAIGVVALAFAVSTGIATSVTGEPGGMSRGFGLMFAWVLGLAAVVLMGWSGARIWRQDRGLRRRSRVLVAVVASMAALLFGVIAIDVVRGHRAEQRALEAAAPVRDIEDDLAEAHRSWSRDQGDPAAIYTGDKTEWWSLDPDGDGRRDQDAPVLRVLRDRDSTASQVSMFDADADLVVDHLQWTVAAPTTAGAVWCAQVTSGPSGILAVRWHRAEPQACDVPSRVSAGA